MKRQIDFLICFFLLFIGNIWYNSLKLLNGESDMTFYEILEISENASQEVIRMAYKALCKKYHPDLYEGDKKFAEEQMKKINEAYDTLSDDSKKKIYDDSLKNRNAHYEPKQEYSPNNIEALLKRGFMALEDSEWLKANQFFEQALNYNAELAEAYIGKLLAEFHFTNISQLKTTILSYEDNPNYLRALLFSNDEFKKFLEECALEHKETIYQFALEEEKENTADKLIDAKSKFENIRDWKDSKEHISKCEQALEEIEKEKKRKKRFILSISAAVSVFLTIILILTKVVIPWQYYKKGRALYNVGKDFESYEYFVKANGYDDSGNVLASFNDSCVALGRYHTVRQNIDGTVIAIGDNSDGQCDVSDWTGIISVAASDYHTLGLRYDGTVLATGNNFDGQCDVSDWEDIFAISAGMSHSVGVKLDGTVVAVTKNNVGQCDVSDWEDIIAISAGTNHTVGLKSDGTVVATGVSEEGQCQVSKWENIIAISAGGNHTVGLKSDGTVVAVGSNNHNQCDVSEWENIISIVAGATWTIGLKSDGTVVATGYNNYNQCNVSEWKDIVAIYGGGIHTVGLTSDGKFIAVGNNYYNQCDVNGWDGDWEAFCIDMPCSYGKENAHYFE